VSSRDFPGPAWRDGSPPDDGLPEYRPADAQSYGAASYDAASYDAADYPAPRLTPPPNGGPARGSRSGRRSDPGAGNDRYGPPQNGDLRYGDPGYGDPRYGDPGYVDPRYGEPRRGQSRHGGSRHGERRRERRQEDPRYVESGRADSGYEDHRHGPARRSGNGYADRGNGYPGSDYQVNGYPGGHADNGQGDGYGADRPVPADYWGGGYGAGSTPPRSLEDSASWYRPAGGYDSTGVGTTSRRSARPGYYTPDDDFTGINAKISAGRDPDEDGFDELSDPYPPRRRPRGRRVPGGPGEPDEPDLGGSGFKHFMLKHVWRGKWWRRWTFKKAGLLAGGIAATMALVLVAAFFVMLQNTVVPIAQLSAPIQQSSLVYFSNGKVVGCFCSVDSHALSESQVKQSKLLVAAVLAAEDRHFFTEGGVSITGILRAAKEDLFGNSYQGASTITEQFVKTYYDPARLGNLTISDKIKEIFVAIKLARMRPKWWILTRYLNSIPLGAGATGIDAAAETYFNRQPWQLTAGQAAMIGAMIQAPYGYEPMNPSAIPLGYTNSLVDRWIYVLTNMVRDGAISQQEMNSIVPDPTNAAAALKDFPKVRIHPPDSSWPGYRGYIMQLVYDELQAYYGYGNQSLAQIGSDGLQIHTTISEHLMNQLYSAVSQNKQEMLTEGVRMPSYINISAVLEQPKTGKILAFYGGPGYGVKNCVKINCQYNTILAAEPVGSSFKPYVLTTAVSQGMDVQTTTLNSHSPLCIPPDWNYTYQHELSKQTSNCHQLGFWPFNEPTENYPINLPVNEATALSNDPAYEDLIHRTTVQAVINVAQTLGVSPIDIAGLNAQFGNGCHIKHPQCHEGAVTAALGEGSLSAVDQANTFADLVSGGISATPHVIDYIVSPSGLKTPAHVVVTRALQPEVAGDVDYALSFDTHVFPGFGGGTGYPNAVWNRPMIAKTGTLGNGAYASQAWFIGAIPQYSLSVGMFTNRPSGNNPEILDGLPPAGGVGGGYGGAWPAHIWHTFMAENFNNIKVEPLPPQGYAGNNPPFTRWIMAPPVKPKKKACKQPGQGHHHHHFFGNQGNGGPCQKNNGPGPSHSPGPSPSPTPTHPSPSPTPTSPSPSPTSPSPSPTSPSPSPSKHGGHAHHKSPGPQSPAAYTTAVVVPATVPDRLSRRAGWVALTSLG
jgi:membrane peptidoglycan carboxypeptidase